MDKTVISTRKPKSPPADTRNTAGGIAYQMSPKESLAQYCATGCVGDTYYASAQDQLTGLKEILNQLEPEYIAQCAIYARERCRQKDMPALLLAYLAAGFGSVPLVDGKPDPKRIAAYREAFHPDYPLSPDTQGRYRAAFCAAFPRVVDNGNMLRSFLQVIRAGTYGRRNLGEVVRRACRAFLANRTDWHLFKDQIGEQPSLADVIKMVRPQTDSSERRAFYRYIIGRELSVPDRQALPLLVRRYEEFKRAQLADEPHELAVPDVDFRQLDALGLSATQWKKVFEHASWTMTRMNLATAKRHGVLDDPELVKVIANRLCKTEAIRRSRDLPFGLMSAIKVALEERMPALILRALHMALEVATENVPELGEGVAVCVDISGSMQMARVTGARKKPTKVPCSEAAAMIAAAILRRNPSARIIPFSDRLYPGFRVNPLDSISTIAGQISALPSGGTACGLPIDQLVREDARGLRAVIMISDFESWNDHAADLFTPGKIPALMKRWETLSRHNPQAKLVCINLQPGSTAQTVSGPNILKIGGFTDEVWRVIKLFLERGNASWAEEIERTSLDARFPEA